jgi:2-dehydropantoate 2-reductase
VEGANVSDFAWPKVAVVGAGAVGCYFGGMLARAGAPVTLIGRQAHVDAIARDGLAIDSVNFQARIPVDASVDLAAARGAHIVLFCVKTLDNEATSRELAPHLGAGAVVVSLQNGVDNVERIRSASGIDAVPAVVYVAAAMTGPGQVKHSGRGDLIIGELSARGGPPPVRPVPLRSIADMFERAGVPCVVSNAIESDMWTKLVANVAANAISALGRSTYGRAVRDPHVREVIKAAIAETLAVAKASGISLPHDTLTDSTLAFLERFDSVYSSTAQDIARGKQTEIDSLNGFIVRRGAALGVPTPVNQTLHALVRLLENAP